MNQRSNITRRTLLQGTAAAMGSLAVVRIAPHGVGATAQDEIVIRWWDQLLPLESAHRSVWDQYQEDHPDVTVEYTVYNPQEQGQALQLAYESEQMPDVHSLAGLGVPTRQLVDLGWFQPLSNGEEIRQALPEGALLEGMTVFDGDVYSFPLFSARQYTTLNWFNKELMEGAGFDPETGPATWDEFRQAAKAITEAGNGRIFGWIQGLNFPERMGVHLEELAQAAGAPGPINHATGEYIYASEPYFQAFEFLLSLQADGSLFPASSTLDARTGRARWATGVAGMFFDGPWNIGVINAEFMDFLDMVGVGTIPTPSSDPSYIHKGPMGGMFWISSQSQNPDIAADILKQFTTPDYYVGLAEGMNSPPLDLSAVERADVHSSFQRAVQLFTERVRLAPSAIVRNPAVSLVNANMADIRPNLGDIVQGVFSGDVTDYRAALQEYNDQVTAERDSAIAAVQAEGGEVSIDDWIFPEWQAGEDFTPDMYG
ncbi:MAG: extracellular solute-binding protein [Chloroflexota bacterium]|nr:extracellular solute-binding protein [Chloroflexota bacterium]